MSSALDFVPGTSVFHRMHVVVKITVMLCLLVLMFTTLGAGGAKIRAVTTNGGVRIQRKP